MSTENLLELFDDYELGRLSYQEKQDLDQRLIEDTEFKAEYDAYLQSALLIKGFGVGNEMRQIMNEEKGKNKAKVFNLWVYSGIAASVALLVCAYIFIGGGADNNELFKSYYEPYPNIITSRSTTGQTMHAGLKAYNSGDYELAVESLDSSSDLSDTLQFYKGLSHLSIDQPQKALLVFEKVPKTSAFIQHVNWYIALAHLQKGDNEACLEQLQLVKQGEFKYKKALQLRKELN